MSAKGSLPESIRKKAFEISYALFRTAAVVRTRSFAEKLEADGVAILDAALIQNYRSLESLLESEAYFLRFGSEANIVHPRNTDLLIQEMGNLDLLVKKAIQEVKELAEANLEGIFSKNIPQKPSVPAKLDSVTAKEEIIAGNNLSADKSMSEKAGIRQSAILERIRQSGNCRIGDLVQIFPGISERTLRYDLEYLIEHGFLERVGSGKATSYQAKGAMEGAISLPGAPQAVP